MTVVSRVSWAHHVPTRLRLLLVAPGSTPYVRTLTDLEALKPCCRLVDPFSPVAYALICLQSNCQYSYGHIRSALRSFSRRRFAYMSNITNTYTRVGQFSIENPSITPRNSVPSQYENLYYE